MLWGTRTDTLSSAGPNTPINFGLVQGVTIDMSYTVKELYGQYQAPVAIARATQKITGKAMSAKISAIAFNDLFFGMTRATSGVEFVSFGPTAAAAAGGSTAIPSTPFQITPTPPNSGIWLDDLGVTFSGVNATNAGLPLIKVTSSPAAGQYSVAAGVYTFSSADHTSGYSVAISYTYTAAQGTIIPVTNQLLGYTPTFQMELYTTFGGNPVTAKFYQVTASKLSFQTKLEDYTIPEFDFSIFANANGNIYDWNFNTVE